MSSAVICLSLEDTFPLLELQTGQTRARLSQIFLTRSPLIILMAPEQTAGLL